MSQGATNSSGISFEKSHFALSDVRTYGHFNEN